MPYTEQVLAKLHAFIAEQDISFESFLLLENIAQCSHMPQEKLLEFTFRDLKNNRKTQTATIESLQHSVEDLLRKALLQKIDANSLAEIEECVSHIDSNEMFDQPLGGVPEIHDVDLTLAGARLYLSLYQSIFARDELTPLCSFVAGENTTTPTIISNDRAYAERGVYSYACENRNRALLACEPVEFFGPWFERWWLQHPEGWKIRMTVENQSSVISSKQD